MNWNDKEKVNEQLSREDDVYEKFASGHSIPVWKRAIDIIGSFFGLIILSPLLLFIAALIKIISPGSVFFRQERIGKSGKVFTLFKFRTMKENNDSTVHSKYLKELINGDSSEEKPMMKIDNDPRIIPLGNFIRSTCLDELPQLFNVLRGDMSLIGPRPPIPYEAEEYLRWHTRRFDITPGLTGLWQVSGKNRTTFKEMIRLDIKYAAERSFWLDLKILFRTPLVVISQFQESLIPVLGKSLIVKKVTEKGNYCLEC
ncbi:MAG: sugar transferase [Candidatus Latescibacteria bacterium]|nr:sugar transferase [Candidatus Latescibacterota bacterium]